MPIYEDDSNCIPRLISIDNTSVNYQTLTLISNIGSTNYTYDNGMLKSYNDYNYNYDILGRRISKISGNYKHKYYYDNNLLIKEELYYNNTIEDTYEYFYDINGSILGFIYNNNYYYYVKDILGRIMRVINQYGNLVASYKYSAFGEIEEVSGSMSYINHIRYKGYYYDDESQMYYLINRYYMPRHGRFLTLDKCKYLDSSNGIGFNLWSYCNNNPVMGYDPEGKFDWNNFWKIAGGAIFGTLGGVGGFIIGNVPGAIVGGLVCVTIGINIFNWAETGYFVSNNSTEASKQNINSTDTYKFSKNEAIAYIRELKQTDSKGDFSDWSEHQMYREWLYHKKVYYFLHFFDYNNQLEITKHARKVDFEKKQDIVTLIFRYIGALFIF